MLRTIDVVMIGALIAAAGYTFKVKHDAEFSVARVEGLKERIRLENEAIDLLKADWSLLTSPQRLERLVERHKEELGLEPVVPKQLGSIADVPKRQENLPPIDGGHAAAEAPDTGTVTGSIPRDTKGGAVQ